MYGSKDNRLTHVVYAVFAVLAAALGNAGVTLYQEVSQRTKDVLEIADYVINHITAFPPHLSVSSAALLGALIGALVVATLWVCFVYAADPTRPGEEHGTARWGTLAEASRYANHENPARNVILSKHIRMTMDRPKNLDFDRNLNVLVIGGSGSGKTAFILTPNALQYEGSYVFTDPKSTLLPKLGQGFLDHGYRLLTFNTLDFEQSMHYNPLSYIRTEDDIRNIITVLMENTSGKNEQASDPFWKDSERLWYQAAIGFLYLSCPREDWTFTNLLKLQAASRKSEESESYVSPVDILFEELEKENPGNFACMNYKSFSVAPAKTANSTLTSVAARLNPFTMPGLQEITSSDDMNLDTLGVEKTALFIAMSATSSTYNFLVAMLLYQLVDRNVTVADVKFDGALPIRLQLFLDEFANCIGKIPDFEKTIAVIRSQNINAWVILQSLAQLDALYGKDTSQVIQDCCDWTVFLGGKSTQTAKTLSETMGKATIKGKSNTTNKGSQGSYSIQVSGLGRELLDPAEISRMPRTKCLVLPANDFPYIDEKFPTFTDPRFKSLKKLNVKSWLKQRGNGPVLLQTLEDAAEYTEGCQLVGDFVMDEASGELKAALTAS